MYNLVSPRILIAVYKEMVRQTKECAFSSAPAIGTVPCTAWL